MSLWKWSQTANSNATADASVPLQEGQAPSTLNNSVRAVMAAIAKFRDDRSGKLTTAGTSTAYTLATNQTLTTLTDGFTVTATIDDTNGLTPTLNVDSLGAKPIHGVVGTAIATGYMLANSVQTFVYNAGADAWVIHGYPPAMYPAAYPDLEAIEALAGTTGVARKTAADTWALDDGTTTLVCVLDNNGTVLTTGVKLDLQIPFACTITGVTALADQSGSIVVDIWKDTYANFPPTDADSITASAPPTITTATKSSDVTLTGWTVAIAAGDVLRFNVDSVSAITRLSLLLKVKRYA